MILQWMNTKLLLDKGELLDHARLVEKSNYLTMTKPDITFVVCVVSQFLSAPKTTNLEAVMRILRYLKKYLGKRLLYSDHRHIQVAGFSDADWTGCHFDRSTKGYCIFLRGNLVL